MCIIYTALVLTRIYCQQFFMATPTHDLGSSLVWPKPTTSLKSVVICACVYLMYTTYLNLIINMHVILISNIHTIGIECNDSH